MHFLVATILAVVPLLASASPLPKQPALIKVPLTKRSNLHRPDGSVNVDKLSGHVAASMARFRRNSDNYERNTGKRHLMQSEGVHAGSKRLVGIEPLDDEHDEGTGSFFTGVIYVGTPETPFTMVIDTSFDDFFLPSSTCDSTCSGHTLYNPSGSSSSKPLGEPFSLWYDGDNPAATGNQYTDTVTIAGFTATSQTVGAATFYGPILSINNFAADGVLGMGFQSNSFFNAPTIINNLVNQGQITSGVFAFKLVEGDSELTIGGLNTDLYSGTPFYTPISIAGVWIVQLSVFGVNGAAVNGFPTVLVSGSPFTYGPGVQINLVYSQISGSQDIGNGFHTFPCSATIPIIHFLFGDNENGATIAISASSLNFGPVSPGSSTCLGSMVGNNPDADLWYLGDSFMRNVYTIFDYDNNQVGFATLV